MSDGKIYNDQFYKNITPDSLTSAKIVVPFLLSLFPGIRSVVDFGCGSGTWLSVFQQFGKKIDGYDFGEGVEQNLLIPPHCYHKHDLTKPIDLQREYSLAISMEVAEHLEPSASEGFIDILTNAAEIILFSAAIPKQGGKNHINCQWPSFWCRLFSSKGYTAFDILRPVFWEVNEICWWYRQNMILYIKLTHENDYKNLKSFSSFNCYSMRIY